MKPHVYFRATEKPHLPRWRVWLAVTFFRAAMQLLRTNVLVIDVENAVRWEATERESRGT